MSAITENKINKQIPIQKPKKSKPVTPKASLNVITYTAKQFAELFSMQNEVTFSANTKIKILNIDPLLGKKYELAASGNAKFEKLLQIFEEVLLLSAKTVAGIKSITEKEFVCSIEVGTNRSNSSLTMHSKKEFSLVTEHGDLNTNAHRLFAKMQYDNVDTFNVGPKQLITFHKVPKAIIKSLQTLSKKPSDNNLDFLSYFSPKDYIFSLQASRLQSKSNTYHESCKKLSVSDKSGIKILLVKAPTVIVRNV